MTDTNNTKQKATFRFEVDVNAGTMRCSRCGNTQAMPIGFGAYTIPNGWKYIFDDNSPVGRVMCDKCFNQYD